MGVRQLTFREAGPSNLVSSSLQRLSKTTNNFKVVVGNRKQTRYVKNDVLVEWILALTSQRDWRGEEARE